MPAGVGEEVSPDWLRHTRKQTNEKLIWLRGTGQSDQRRAAIDRIIAERSAGVETPTAEMVKTFAEPRTVAEFQERRQEIQQREESQRQIQAILSKKHQTVQDLVDIEVLKARASGEKPQITSVSPGIKTYEYDIPISESKELRERQIETQQRYQLQQQLRQEEQRKEDESQQASQKLIETMGAGGEGEYIEKPTSETYKGIQVTETYYVDPVTRKERPVTASEREQLVGVWGLPEEKGIVSGFMGKFGLGKEAKEVRETKKLREEPLTPAESIAELVTLAPVRNLYGRFKEGERRFAETTTIPTGKIITEKTGVTIPKVSEVLEQTIFPTKTPFISSKYDKDIREFRQGIISGTLTDVKEKPISNVMLFGAGGLVGGTVKGTTRAVLTVSKEIKSLGLLPKLTEGVETFQKGVGIVRVETPTIGKVIEKVRGLEQPVYLGLKKIEQPLFTTKQYVKGGVGLGFGGLYAGVTAERILSAGSPREAGSELGIATKDLLLFGAGYKKGAESMTLTTTRTPLRKLIPVEAEETQRPLIIRGKETDIFTKIATYEIKGEVRPPTLITKTTPLREWYYQQPKTSKVLPQREFTTIAQIIGDKPFYATTKIGKYGQLKVLKIKGSSEEVNLKLSVGDTNIQKFLTGRLGENILKDVSLKEVYSLKTPKISMRLSPLRYGLKLKEEGKILFRTMAQKKLGRGTLGLFYPEGSLFKKQAITFSEKLLGDITFKKFEKLSLKKQLKHLQKYKEKREEVIAHELIHYKAEGFIPQIESRLPYRLRPSEILAFGLEKPMAKFGFKTKFKPTKIEVLKLGEEIPRGVYVKPEDVPSLIPKDTKVFRGALETRKVFTPYGKSTEVFETISTLKPLKKTELVETFTSDVLFKDVTKPYSRATGKTPKIKTEITFIKEPLIIDLGAKTKVIKPADIKKTSLDKTFQIQELNQVLITPKVLPKITKPVKVETITEVQPRTIPISTYAGTGLYERTEVYGATPQAMVRTQLQVQPLPFKTFDIVDVKPFTDLKLKMDLISASKMKQATKIKQVTKLKQAQKIKTQQKIKQKMAIKQAQKQKQKLKLKLTTRIITPPPPTIIKRIFQTTKPPIPPIFPRLKPTKARRQPKGYEVFIRRFGKFKPIGAGLTLAQAQALGIGKVSRGLGATYKVTGADLRGLITPKGFYKKVTPKGMLFIEKRKHRLSKVGEKKEIQFWKKRKTKKKKRKK